MSTVLHRVFKDDGTGTSGVLKRTEASLIRRTGQGVQRRWTRMTLSPVLTLPPSETKMLSPHAASSRGDDGPLDFTWRPRDEAAWGDNIFVSLGGNVRTGLSVMRVHRRWTPWPVRLIREASVRLSTPLVPVPSSLNTRCKTVDMTALRRDLGSVLGADVPLHSLRRPYLGWDELVSRLSDTHTVAAHWDPPYPTLRVAEHDMT